MRPRSAEDTRALLATWRARAQVPGDEHWGRIADRFEALLRRTDRDWKHEQAGDRHADVARPE